MLRSAVETITHSLASSRLLSLHTVEPVFPTGTDSKLYRSDAAPPLVVKAAKLIATSTIKSLDVSLVSEGNVWQTRSEPLDSPEERVVVAATHTFAFASDKRRHQMLGDVAVIHERDESSPRESLHDRVAADNIVSNPQDDDYSGHGDMDPLLSSTGGVDGENAAGDANNTSLLSSKSQFRSRKASHMNSKRRRRRKPTDARISAGNSNHSKACCCCKCRRFCKLPYVKSTLVCMNVVARILVWCNILFLAAAVFWYSYELFNHGTDPHLIAWFSAGAFVLLGFPISMWGIVSHLANYNQPHVQVYVVRILWMVPIYSIESWLAMRFHKQAIYIETLRDLYESYVLYSFLQFLIQVLGGEEALILMLKDKSPTRGQHIWGMSMCNKPWLMGQPVRRTVYDEYERPVKRIHWKSPFFVKCKLGVLQYVLLKFVSSIAVMILELQGWYREGDFTPKGGYLYICILTNASQCWALYCLIFFYYSVKTELAPIRPVGKFLAVKSLVFFTWYQQVGISILFQMGLIPHYSIGQNDWEPQDVAKAIQDYLICIEMFVAAVVHSFVFPHTEYSPQAVEARQRALNQTPMRWQRKRLGRRHNAMFRDDLSKGSQDVEMASLASTGLDSDSWPEHVASSNNSSSALGSPQLISPSRTSSFDSASPRHGLGGASWEDELRLPPLPDENEEENSSVHHSRRSDRSIENDATDGEDEEELVDDSQEFTEEDEVEITDNSEQSAPNSPRLDNPNRPGFVRALLDSAIPRDLGVQTVGLVKGDYNVERKTLLHHASTSDQYDLFSHRRHFRSKISEPSLGSDSTRK